MLGLVGNICLAFLFFPVTRGSSILQLIGLTSESSIKYHIWLGHIAMTLFTAHGLCYIIFWAKTNQVTEVRATICDESKICIVLQLKSYLPIQKLLKRNCGWNCRC